MKSIYRNIISYLLIGFLFGCSSLVAQDQTFTAEQIKEDIVYLEAQLRMYHPNLYSYSTQADFITFYARLKRKLPEVMSESEAYRIISHSSTLIKDGHTYFYPNPQHRAPVKNDLKFFPASIYWNGTKLYVLQNLSAREDILPGQEIVSINGIPSDQIVQTMISSLMRDGDNLNYPVWVLNQFFPAYYGFQFGYPSHFDLVLKTNEESKPLHLDALSSNEINKFRKHRYFMTEAKPLQYEIDIRKKVGILHIADWHKFVYREINFKKEIKTFFKKIEKLGIDKIVIDLRGNQGGSLAYSKFLLKRLLRKSFVINTGYKKVTKNNQSTETYSLSTAKGPNQGNISPIAHRFKGALAVLIDGGSFSNSAIFCSVLQENKRAIFIGEETGGSATLLAGGAKKVWLPHTKIEVQIPTLQYNINNKTLHKGGVVPDVKIKPTIEELVACEDPALEMAIEKISN